MAVEVAQMRRTAIPPLGKWSVISVIIVIILALVMPFVLFMWFFDTPTAFEQFRALEAMSAGRDAEMSIPSCLPSLSVSNPFNIEGLWNLYDPEGLSAGKIKFDLAAERDRWQRLRHSVNVLSESCDGRQMIKQLLEDGLVGSPFGMDFSGVQAKRCTSEATCRELHLDEDVVQMRRAYFDTIQTNFHWDVDFPQWYKSSAASAAGLTASEERLLADFRRDGFLRIDRWLGIEIQDVIHEAAPNIKHNQNNDLLSVHGLLQDGSLLRKLTLGYLGAEVVYNGVETFHLEAGATRASYGNAPWHHDGCGTRLKAFVYLTDVNERTPHTLIAAGTHHTMWYPTTHYFAGREAHNKLNETVVLQHYGNRITKMLAPSGGGFIFDTNALHGAFVEGLYKRRDVLVLDFAAAKHQESMPRGPRGPHWSFPQGWTEGLCPGDRKGGKPFKFVHH